MKIKKFTWLITVIVLTLFLFGCPDPTNIGGGVDLSIGDTETVTIGSETRTMIYANNSTGIIFPIGLDDSGSSTLTTKFWMGETEVSNAVMVEVLQWAYNNSRFSSTVSDHNGLTTWVVKHGGQQLLRLDHSYCRVDYDGSGGFSAEGGYEDNPVTSITWYGSVMFCNWLTEMRDGNTSNVVYTNIDTDWIDDEIIETVSKTGYRLPTSTEWVYAARYREADSTNTVSGYINPYYTQGNSASGATADYNNALACRAVAVYSESFPGLPEEAAVKSLGNGSANALVLYDMSGNVWEWCFTESGSDRILRGGGYNVDASYQQVGYVYNYGPDVMGSHLGFRLCRTAND